MEQLLPLVYAQCPYRIIIQVYNPSTAIGLGRLKNQPSFDGATKALNYSDCSCFKVDILSSQSKGFSTAYTGVGDEMIVTWSPRLKG